MNNGALFMDNGANEVDDFVRFSSILGAAVCATVIVTYIGNNKSGCPFFGALVGTVIDGAAGKSGNPVQLQPFVDTQHERLVRTLSPEQRAAASAAWSSALRAKISEQQERDAEAARYTPWWSPEEQRGDDL